MKKISIIFILLAFAFGFMASEAIAAGGKVRGEEGAGQVNQYCVHPDGSAECPFIG